ncbi:MAG: tRNA uridine(34) 5-carboxymethylaminomethyl modification radical SAM/GNAT enzyme Elp3 [Candidatus Thorarchaeota archaeon]|nr:tRNA uridine(34) 5-carboxymethylaminomethyl modification radical SAM/GNAT enzyme Elp3 [Candidatus Thorarchaeota archaeon]
MPEATSASVCREIIEEILRSEVPLDRHHINRLKNRVCARYHLPTIPSNADILGHARPEEVDFLSRLLRKRPVRTASGVAVIAVMTRPQACPHGKCAYCPGGPDLGVPQSYTGHEPATMRGIQNDFDPFRQVHSRLDQLRATGHTTQKAELIVMGGDWCSKDAQYRAEFVKRCLDAMNQSESGSLDEAKRKNERAPVRNIGTTFETRPDLVTPGSVDELLYMGATRVEIGVQTLSDSILHRVSRGHGVDSVVRASQLLRDSGIKVAYHMMPGLPGATFESDLNDFRRLFSDPAFRPDMLKIYPTIVVKHTKLYEWWTAGEYRPYDTDQTVGLLATAIAEMPEYVRIQRMQRDIPLHQIEAGLDCGNLRELVQKRMNQLGLRDRTIRYREVGHYELRTGKRVNMADVVLVRREYDASGGKELFLSLEVPEDDVLVGFLRLRRPSTASHRREMTAGPCAIIRELRVYGTAVELRQRRSDAWQHFGMGEWLIEAAESIGRDELGADTILVNSGLGVKEYYRRLGFRDLGPYMAKSL